MIENQFNFISDYLSASLRLSIPLAFAANGGLLSERAGILNIALEGMLLTGAFVSAAIAFVTNNAMGGIVGGIIVSGLVGLIHGFLCITLKVNQIVSGLAINLSVTGLTSFCSRLVFNQGTTAKLPTLSPLSFPLLHKIPLIGNLLFQQDLLFYLLLLLIVVNTYVLFNTSFGLSLRAVGEYPLAAKTAGISVTNIRYLCMIFSGCLCGLGGSYLALIHVQFFNEGMIAGKGFIALAAVIFGRWHPLGVTLASFLFGATDALQLRIQALNLHIPYQLLVILPYLITLLALLGFVGRSQPPASLGKEHH